MNDCGHCGGTGIVDSGGFTPWGQPIDIPCPFCEQEKHNKLAEIGAAWEKDSSLEKWFPITAEKLKKLESEPRINPEWVKSLEQELEETRKARDEFIWVFSIITCILQGNPGWETAKEYADFGHGIVKMESIALAKTARRAIEAQKLLSEQP